MPGIPEQQVLVDVAGECPAHDDIDVLITVVVEVAEGDAVAFLNVAEPAGGGDVLEEVPVGIAEHAVRYDGPVVGLTGSGIEVQKAVVVEVTEVRAHRQQRRGQVGGLGEVFKRAVPVVVVQTRRPALVRQAEIIGDDISGG